LRIRTLLATAALFSACLVAHADTIYNNFSSGEDASSLELQPGVAEAVAFTPNGNYVLTGATVLAGENPQANSVVEFAIYSSVDGTVGTSLMNLGSHTLTVSPLTGGANTFSATGTLDLLQGQRYWLVAIQNGGGDFIWLGSGSSAEPGSYSNDSGVNFGPVSDTALEFAITGTPYTPTAAKPEPSSFALLGSGLLGFAGVLRKRLG
jgi:hypothetical protein